MKYKGCKNKEFRGLQITYPASGFQNDVVKILERFVATKSIRFEDFAVVWKACNFTLVFLGRTGIREKREFMEEAFAIILKYIMPPFNLQVRVGGVYLLYSMYHTQRLKTKVRIRIPLSCWPNFCHLQQEVVEQRHLDAAYIIRRLIADRVFMLCAYPSTLSVDEVYLHQDKDRPFGGGSGLADSSSLGEGSGLLAQIQDEDSIGQLHAVHEKYHRLKCELNLNSGGAEDRPGDSINLIKPDIAESILSIINHTEGTTPHASKRAIDIETEESSERAKRLKSLKEAASSSKPNQGLTRYRRIRDPERTASPASENVVNLTRSGFVYKKRGRPSAKPPEVPRTCEAISSDSEGGSSASSDKLVSDNAIGPREDGSRQDFPFNNDENRSNEKVPSTGSTRRNSRHSHTFLSAGGKEQDSEWEADDCPAKKKNQTISDSEKKEPSHRVIEVSPGTFIAIRPDDRSPNQPVLAKVVAVENADEIKVVPYKGHMNSVWTPITAVNRDDNEAKPLVETVSLGNVILAGFTLTKGNRLQERIKKDLRQAMKNADKN